jgi:hypothetical protein
VAYVQLHIDSLDPLEFGSQFYVVNGDPMCLLEGLKPNERGGLFFERHCMERDR